MSIDLSRMIRRYLKLRHFWVFLSYKGFSSQVTRLFDQYVLQFYRITYFPPHHEFWQFLNFHEVVSDLAMTTRKDRVKTNKLAAVSNLFDEFIRSSKLSYTGGFNLKID